VHPVVCNFGHSSLSGYWRIARHSIATLNTNSAFAWAIATAAWQCGHSIADGHSVVTSLVLGTVRFARKGGGRGTNAVGVGCACEAELVGKLA